MNINNYILSINDCDEIFSSIILPRFIESLVPQENPMAYILGGQPGAGKSHYIRVLKNKPGNINLSVINGDDLRGYHPFYYQLLKNDEHNAADLTQKNINYWIEKLIQEIANRQGSMIIEGTMRNSDASIKTAETLSRMQYEVTANIILTNPRISNADIFFRYIMQKKISGVARFTKSEVHKESVHNLYGNILTINKSLAIKHLKVYYRKITDYELLYERTDEENEQANDNEKELSNCLRDKINCEMTPEELKYVEKIWKNMVYLSETDKEMSDFLKRVKKYDENYFFENESKFPSLVLNETTKETIK